MSIQPIPGFRGTIEVTNDSGQKLFKTSIASQAELIDFKTRYGQSKEQWGLFRSAVCPLNLGSITQFVCDVTLPTLFNFALKVQSVVYRLIASIFAIGFDLITLPIRILAVPFVIAFAKSDSPHILQNLIEQQNPQKVTDEVVTINYTAEEVIAGINAVEKYGSKEVVTGALKVALKTTPFFSYESSSRSEKTTYLIDRGTWTSLAHRSGDWTP